MQIIKDLIEAIENPESLEGMQQVADRAKKMLDVFAKLPTPLFSLVIVKPFDVERKQGGLILTGSDNQRFGVVIKKGEQAPSMIKEGDRIVWFTETGEEMEFEGETFIIMNLPEKTLVL